MSKTKKIVLLSILGALVIGYLVGVRVFYKEFLPNTYLHGVNIGTMTEEEAVDTLTKAVHPTFDVVEMDGVTEQISLNEINYVADYEKIVHEMMKNTSSFTWPVSLVKRTENTTGGEVSFDAKKLKDLVHNLNAIAGENIRAPKNAYISQNDGKYEIVKEDDGNKLNEDRAFGAIKYALARDEGSVNLEEEGCYLKAEIRQDNKTLNDKFKMIQKIDSLTITINMVDANEILTADKIIDMGSFNRDKYVLNEDSLAKYVDWLAEKYDTYKKKRPFMTTNGEQVEVGSSYDTLGFSMSKKETINRLKTAIRDRKSTTINAAWDVAGVCRGENGNDIGTTYVEVSLARQHLWYYREGNLVMESDVVTGLTNGRRNTPGGVFKVWGKERNAVLRGDDYETPVSYWMPITWTGVGLHDANWRGSFGGGIYRYNGSHGCVNMPPSKAGELFNAVALNTPVVIY